MQRTLAADREGDIANWRGYRKAYPDVVDAGSTFVKNVLETEIQMEFNAAAIKKLEAEAAATPLEQKPSGPTLPRYRGH